MGAVLRPSGSEWEAWRQYASSLLKVNGRYHLYYQAWARPHGVPLEGAGLAEHNWTTTTTDSNTGEKMPVKFLSQHSLCVAVSDDGIQWHKPSLGIATFNGSRANNIL